MTGIMEATKIKIQKLEADMDDMTATRNDMLTTIRKLTADSEIFIKKYK